MPTHTLKNTFLDVCDRGFSALGKTPEGEAAAKIDGFMRQLQFEPGYPPSYLAQIRYRFLRTLQAAQSIPHKSVLEVAAGGGFNGICLLEPGKRVVLNDMRFLEEELKSWPAAQGIEVVMSNLFDLDPRKTGQFDLVIACEVIEHIAHGDQFIRHLKQLLSPRGTLLLTTPNGNYFRSKLPTYSQIQDFGALETRQFEPDASGHLYLYTKTELEGLLRAEGFASTATDFSITPWISGHMGLRFLPSWRMLAPIYYTLDRLICSLGASSRERFCTQMITTATLPA